MTTNTYFNHYNATNEQNLIDSLIVEAIQTMGISCVYIPRTQDNIDYLFNEDSSSSFESFGTIEMWPASVEGFDGEQLMTIFGDEFKKSATFIVSRSRFSEELPIPGKPIEGDLIFMPITNTVFEIKYVDHESPFFEKGKQYVYEVKVEAFEYSYEDIQTGDTDLDMILDDLEIPNQDTETEEYGQNSELENDASTTVEWSPNNPFL